MRNAPTNNAVRPLAILALLIFVGLLLAGCAAHSTPPPGQTPPPPTQAPTHAAPPTPTEEASTPTPSAQIQALLGTWLNEDPLEGSPPRVEIALLPEGLRLHLWGKCQPEDCDIGLWSIPIEEASQGSFIISYDFARGNTSIAFSLLPDGRLQAETTTDFTEDSGLTDTISTAIMVRVGE
jgi:hypothetical protein